MPPGGNHRQSVPQGVERTAQELVHEAGSVPKAKKAIDRADKMEDESDFREDQLAVRLGFKSRKDLLAASKPIQDAAGNSWWATRTPEDFWIVWNDETVKSTKHKSLEEAKRSISNQDPSGEQAAGTAFPEGFNG
jgi:hypothetical protein